jgi:hypothetical protein
MTIISQLAKMKKDTNRAWCWRGWFLFVGYSVPSVIEEKGEGFENGKGLWLEWFSLQPKLALQSLIRLKIL